jgi:CDGSH-type Zn-finger protein
MFIEIKSLRSESWQTSPSKRSATALTTSPAALSFWTNSAKEYAESALDALYLCRCGASKNKPLCDGSPEEVRFKAEETGSSWELDQIPTLRTPPLRRGEDS